MAGRNEQERRTVAGLFRDPSQAERAIGELRAAGFDSSDIGLAAHSQAERDRLDRETGMRIHESAEGIVKGGASGFMEKIAAWFGAEGGDLVNAFTDEGFTDAEARRFDQGFRAGQILLTVHTSDRRAEAESVLRACGADLGMGAATAASATASTAGTTGTTRPDTTRGRKATTAAAATDEAERQRLELREERLRVDKEQVQAGEIRVRKEVVSEEQHVDVPVSHEEVVIERHPVTGEAARSGDVAELREGEEIRVPIMEERVRVEKTPVVKEEVTVGKRKVQETKRVEGTVRHEEARIESSGDVRRLDEEEATEPWRGNERRFRHDPSYTGPERRLAHA